MNIRYFLGFTGLLVVAAAVAGCGKADAGSQIDTSTTRAKFVLADEPEGAMGVLDVRDAMPRSGEMVIVGRIGGPPNPWTDGQATFVMADASLALESDGKHDCDDPGCAFCKKSASKTEQKMLAIVQFVGEDGKVVPVDAQKLFDVSANDMVVVRGKAGIGEDGWLVVAANGLYVRR